MNLSCASFGGGTLLLTPRLPRCGALKKKKNLKSGINLGLLVCSPVGETKNVLRAQTERSGAIDCSKHFYLKDDKYLRPTANLLGH